jgi:hypothetical protein
MFAFAACKSVAPAQAGAYYVYQSWTTSEIGSSLRWCDVACFGETGGLD